MDLTQDFNWRSEGYLGQKRIPPTRSAAHVLVLDSGSSDADKDSEREGDSDDDGEAWEVQCTQAFVD